MAENDRKHKKYTSKEEDIDSLDKEQDNDESVRKDYPVKEESEYDKSILIEPIEDKKETDKKTAKKKTNGSPIRSVLKKSMIGMEVEMFTLDENGNMANLADVLIKEVKKKYPLVGTAKEAGRSTIEIKSFPNEAISDTMEHLLEEMESVLICAEKENIRLFPLGTFPGSFTPDMRQDTPYLLKEQIFGKNRFLIAGRCVGLHIHYTLPWGVFDSKQKILKRLHRSKNQQTMVGSYNLLIAMDPALTTFMQSSPFYQGKYIGKDSRVIVYRGGSDFDYPQGLYANYYAFGALQPYKQTNTDMIDVIFRKYDEWKNIIQKIDMNLRVFSKHGSILDTTWNPVKVNAVGTLEQRGMDTNHPMYMTAAGALIKYILRYVEDENINVIPSDIGVAEPFKLEGNVMYIPPHTHVRKNLQRNAAYDGLDNREVYDYCKILLKLASQCIPKDKEVLLDPFRKIIDEKKTVSDEIIELAKKKGADLKETLPKSIVTEIALEHSGRLFKEIVLTKKMLHDLK
ncbi:MAG: hypothetical protein JW716_01080 [Candidatus Aenigmarchaeota archaeon]|nr:hypothetical protein [Candidatus Aenigmarchaeota archaeon]